MNGDLWTAVNNLSCKELRKLRLIDIRHSNQTLQLLVNVLQSDPYKTAHLVCLLGIWFSVASFPDDQVLPVLQWLTDCKCLLCSINLYRDVTSQPVLLIICRGMPMQLEELHVRPASYTYTAARVVAASDHVTAKFLLQILTGKVSLPIITSFPRAACTTAMSFASFRIGPTFMVWMLGIGC